MSSLRAKKSIGDLANSKTLDIFEKTIGQDARNVYRWRIEHAQFLQPADIGRIAENHYIPSMQPRHATSDMKWVESRLGLERAQTTYAWRSLIKAGAIVPGGSDAPVEPVNPYRPTGWGLHSPRKDHPIPSSPNVYHLGCLCRLQGERKWKAQGRISSRSHHPGYGY